MHNLLNRYAGKLSWNSVLRSPPDSATGNGDGTQTSSNDNGDSNDDNNGDDGDGDDDSDFDPSDLGDDGDVDDDDFDITSADSEYQQTPEDIEAGKALGEKIKADLAAYDIPDAEIPADFDPNDPKQLKQILANTQRQAIGSTLQMIVPILNHALGNASKQLKHYVNTKGSETGAKSKIVEGFRGLGASSPQEVALLKPIYQRALKAHGNDPAKAAVATRKAAKLMGVSLNGSTPNGKGSNGKNNNTGTQTRSGAAALDDLFGKIKTK